MEANDILLDFVRFLESSPTAWQATDHAAERLLDSGFTELHEGNFWSLEPEGKYFVIRNGSSLCAFILPKENTENIRLIGSHTDSPGFKLKPHPEYSHKNMVMFGVEVYGSPLLNSWLNRDLGIAGRVMVLNEQGHIEEHHVVLDQHPVTIPQLAIHLDREVNSKGLLLNKQQHTSAIATLEKIPSGNYLERLLRDRISFQTLLGHDLFLYPLDRVQFLGQDYEMLSSYRIDNLAGVHASLLALLEQEVDVNTLKMVMFWDNEEVGSATPQGAESPFVSHVLERILERPNLLRILAKSLCVSVDLAHAVHPNYPEKHDPLHSPVLGGGIVIKHNAQQRYATDARSLSDLKKIATEQKIPLQEFVVRSDIPCGSTIGPLHAKMTGMPTVDIGIPQLSMHAARELIACEDHVHMVDLLSHIFKYK
ncbi:MAG: putative M18 family aminopeptidase 2 [Chlamydiae bacterium]|nr:putative M18 family aminopeptidase 2 [Chlamydiota bacterium]